MKNLKIVRALNDQLIFTNPDVVPQIQIWIINQTELGPQHQKANWNGDLQNCDNPGIYHDTIHLLYCIWYRMYLPNTQEQLFKVTTPIEPTFLTYNCFYSLFYGLGLQCII